MRLRKLIPMTAKLQLYKSAILPHLTYCHIVWNFCKVSDRKKLERIQEKALKAVYNTNNLTYNELLCRAKLPTLYNRRLQDIAVLMYKVKNNLSPPHITELFRRKEQRYELRNADFELPRFKSVRYGKHSLRYFGPYLWSKLEMEDREYINLKSFISNIRKKDLESILEGGCRNCGLCSN